MTTFASPTLGGADRALWQVEMNPGMSGPPHVFDAEQVWTVLAGGAAIELDGERFTVEAGDTVVMPAAATRQVTSDAATGLVAIVTAPAGARVGAPGTDPNVVPPWIV